MNQNVFGAICAQKYVLFKDVLQDIKSPRNAVFRGDLYATNNFIVAKSEVFGIIFLTCGLYAYGKAFCSIQ